MKVSMRKKQVAVGTLTTNEIKDFMENVCMLQISVDNKLDVKMSRHKIPANTWLVSLWTSDKNRDILIESLAVGHLAHKWIDKFLIKLK